MACMGTSRRYIPPLVGSAVETPPVVRQMAWHQNCAPTRVSRNEFECVQITQLPWPANEGIRWHKSHIRDLWPPSLVELFENDDTVRRTPTDVKSTRSKRGDAEAEKDKSPGAWAVGSNRLEGGGPKSRRTDTPEAAGARAPKDIRPPGGTRSVDPMPARGRTSSASPEAPVASREAPIDVDEQEDVEIGLPARRETSVCRR